ncbi:MAG: glycerate kinase [Hyphomicrobiales bacterium]
MPEFNPRLFLADLFHAAVDAADPAKMLKNFLPQKPKGRLVVVGAGKASAHMAQALEAAYEGALEGLVVTRHGSAVPCESIEIIESAHPVPDEGSFAAARRMINLVEGLGADDTVLALISGGGSSLLSLPPDAVTPEDKQAANTELLRCGASIHEMNCVRKHVSAIKGGRLAAAAHPAKVVTLVISDIPGDDPALVASGPTVPSHATRADALDIIKRYEMTLPENVMAWMASDACEAPRPDDAAFANDEVHVIAAAQLSLEAAARVAREGGWKAHILSDAIEGEAADVGQVLAALARQTALRNQPFERPCILLSGGETTVTVRHKGKGGRNTELLLSAAFGLEGLSNVHALAADTDGIDGSENNAGAFIDGNTIKDLQAKGLKPLDYLNGNDAYSAFEAIDALFVTGPTSTNVNDFRAFLIL